MELTKEEDWFFGEYWKKHARSYSYDNSNPMFEERDAEAFMVAVLDWERKRQGEEVRRMRAALMLIAAIEEKRNMHLGRPRSSDKSCIFCLAYIAANDGDYGESWSAQELEERFFEVTGKRITIKES